MSASISSAHNPINAVQTANAASSIAPGTTSTLAAGSAPPTARSYASATRKPVSSPPIASSTAPPVAVGGPAQSQHGKSSSISPVNGKPHIQPAVPSVGPPTIVNSSGVNGAATQGDHSRKPSVTISASGATGYMPNGGPVTNRAPTSLTFGSLAAGGSPAISHSVPHHPQAANLSTPINNPRITSPAASPSPIPQPASSGGRPPADLQSSQRIVFGGVGGEGGESNMRPVSMPPGQNPIPQAQHLRRESSQSAHSDMSNPNMNGMGRGYGSGGGRGRGYTPNFNSHSQMAHSSPSPAYRQLSNPQRGPNMPPQFQNHGPMGQPNSPFRQTRSPALTPATVHSQVHLANNPQMQYPPYGHTQHFQPQPGLYGMPPQAQLDPNFAYYPQHYQMHPQMQYGGAAPPSPRPNNFPPQMAQPYIPGPYGNAPHAQGMSRTPSQVSERPPSTTTQPQTPAMSSVNHVSHTHTPSASSNSPAPSSTFAIPPKSRSKAIPIKNIDGTVMNFDKKSASPAPPPQPRSPAVVSTPTPPPRAPSATESQHSRSESTISKSAAEKKKEFAEQVQRVLEEEERQKAAAKAKEVVEHNKRVQDDAERNKRMQEENEKAEADRIKLEKERKDKEEAERAAAEKVAAEKAAAEKAAAEKARAEKEEAERIEREQEEKERLKREEDERLEREIAEMEERERLEEERERAFQEKRQKENEEKARKEAEAAAHAEEELRRQEREAEEREEAREKARKAASEETTEQKAEREKMFASLKKSNLGPSSNVTSDSGASTPPAEVSMPPPAQPRSASSGKQKPLPLKLETNKPVEPAQPTAGMQALKSARFLQVRSELVNYPEGIKSPNPALNQAGKSKGRQYDKDFLLQFQEVFKEKPSTDWDNKVKETVGDSSDSARPQSARIPSSGMGSRQPSRPSLPAGMSGGTMGSFASVGRTLRPGTTSEERFQQSLQGSTRQTMSNPLAQFANRPGGFPMGGPPQMNRTGSFPNMAQAGPNSPRNNSQRGKGSRRGLDKAPSRREEEQAAKAMPLTAGVELKPLEKSNSGWKPMSISAPQAQQQQIVASGHMPPDMVQRKVKAALNKMTPEKFDKIADQILEIAAQSRDETDGRTLRQVIQLTFEKACDEAHWASMYAKFCKRMLETMSPEIKDENVRDRLQNPVVGGALFRKYLLNRCQEEFERGWEVNLPEKPEGQNEGAVMLSDEYYIAAAAKRRGLGLIQFIGELYKLGMLTLRIMHECVLKLLDFEGTPDESAIESLAKLLRTVGYTMENTEAGPKMINMYFERIQKVMNTEGLPSRMHFMLLDVVDLRKKGWKSKDDAKGPKTIQEIHQEALVAQQQAELERSRSNQRGGGPRQQMGRSDARSFSGNSMMPPPDYPRNQLGMDDLRKLSKGASGRNLSNSPAQLGPSSMFTSRSSSGRKGLGPSGLMRGGEESGASSRTATPPTQKDKESTNHVNSFSALAALDASGEGAGDVASPPSTASSPPVSKSQPARTQSKSPATEDKARKADGAKPSES